MMYSTPLRKSILKKQNEDFLLSPLEAEVSDDNERQKRRTVYHVECSLSSIPDSNSASSDTIERIMQHIKACQKLCNENKINIRNAWEVKLIDYIYYYVSKNTRADFDLILEVARTLEVCVKVYGYKVDYLSQEVVKLVSTMDAQADKGTENMKQLAEISDTNKLKTLGLVTNDIVYDDDGVPVPHFGWICT